MAAFFLDSSALVKRYVAEIGSAWISSLLDPSKANRIYIASIAGAEVTAALARRKIAPVAVSSPLSRGIAEFRADFQTRFHIIEITMPLIRSAMDLAEQHSLRGYDSVQLAAALALNAECFATGIPCTLVSSDDELNAASSAEGLVVENPNNHP